MAEMAVHGNPASRSDLEVGARALELGVWGAHRNVLINLGDVEDELYRRRAAAEAEALVARAREKCAAVLAASEKR
jgi:glutamate formiminotransferase/formiminotetrahydrofolate cyclodeaminase